MGGMMGGGMMTLAPGASAGVGMNGQMMNNMMAACTDMMSNLQQP